MYRANLLCPSSGSPVSVGPALERGRDPVSQLEERQLEHAEPVTRDDGIVLDPQAQLLRHRPHAAGPDPVAMVEQRRKDFHLEFTTLRFSCIGEHGAWEGRASIVPHAP